MGFPIVVDTFSGVQVVRDDLVPGGTKRRVLAGMLSAYGGDEYVYASPAYGYAQIALAYASRSIGKQATVFVAKRKQPHKRTLEAKLAGAKVMQVPNGYLNVVTARAKAYCEATGAMFLPFGLDDPVFLNALAGLAIETNLNPNEVWTAAGSGTLTRALQIAWPNAKFYAVQVGKDPNVGRAHLLKAPEDFADDAKIKPPFPSCSNYDAKVWRFILKHASPGALFWNVAA